MLLGGLELVSREGKQKSKPECEREREREKERKYSNIKIVKQLAVDQGGRKADKGRKGLLTIESY